MAKTFKAVSHERRINDDTIKHVVKFDKVCRKELRKKQELDETTKRVVSRMSLTDVDSDRLKHLKVSDFSLENLQSIGYVSKPCSLRMSTLSSIDNIVHSLPND